MKQYKFRAWVKFDSGRYGMLDNDNLQVWTLEELTDGEDILMQYTGIKDSGGKDIYEGDILEYEWDFGGGLQKTELEVTDWAYGNCIFCSGGGFNASDINKNFKIIGNIYETN